jgi:predicted Zn-dependent protease
MNRHPPTQPVQQTALRARGWLLGLLLAVATAQAAAAPLPEIGDPSAAVLTPAAERELGEALLKRLRSENALLEDLEVNSYLTSLGSRLTAHSGQPPGSLTFFMVRDPNINAFAAPGGMIGINSGLLTASQSESELAAVLAHEIAHVSQRHMARTFEAAGRLQIPVAVGILAAILLGSADPQAGQAALATTMATSAQQQIDTIRGNEEEADGIGIQILAAAGYDPNGMPDFFARLERMQRLYGDVVPEFLGTHPVNVARIARARDRVTQLPQTHPGDETSYRLIRMKVEVLTHTKNDTYLDELRTRIENGDSEARYALALAQIGRGQGQAASTTLAPLLADNPDRPEYIRVQAEALAASGDLQRADDLYRDALDIYPGHRALTLGYAELLINRQRPAEARTLLENEVRAGRASREVHQLLSHAAFNLGDEVEGRGQRAEWLLLDGRPGEAIDELQRAQAVSNDDDYRAARIAARLQQARQQLGKDPRKPPPRQ